MTALTLERPLAFEDGDTDEWVTVETQDETVPTASTIQTIESFSLMRDGWAGPGSTAPTRSTVATAREIAGSLLTPPDAVSPLNDGEIMFEWRAPEGELFLHVVGETVVMVALGESNEAEITLPRGHAAAIVEALLGRSRDT